MPAEPAAKDFLDRPGAGRVVERDRKVRLGDVDRAGRLRLDALARYLQDVATDDADDAGLDRRFGWLVRRTKIRVTEPATLGERLSVATWCTGIGRSWAERRTELIGDKGARLDTVSLWVQIDVQDGRPAAIGTDFTDAYAEACAGRRVSARLALPSQPEPDGDGDGQAVESPWHVRSTDLDPFDHVNNAATWAIVEEHLGVGAGRGIAELEYPQPITAGGQHRVYVSGNDLWFFDGETVAAVARWSPDDAAASTGP